MKIRPDIVGFTDRHIRFWVDLGDGKPMAAAATVDELSDTVRALSNLRDDLERHNAEMHMGRLFRENTAAVDRLLDDVQAAPTLEEQERETFQVLCGDEACDSNGKA